MYSKEIKIEFLVSDAEALAAAQFLKRLGFGEVKANAVDDVEAGLMRGALDKFRCALECRGYNPR